MTISIRVPVLALAGLLAAAGAACAQTPADVARDWGLLGVWRLDCTVKANRSDPDLKYVVRNGKLYHERDWGDGGDSSEIIAARITPEGGIALTVRFTSLGQTREFIDVKQDERHIHAIMSRNVDTNEYSIRDGRFVDGGRVPPMQTHCQSGT
jgi:hypothetical protein